MTKKLILALLMGLMLAAPVSGKILIAYCNGDPAFNEPSTPSKTIAINNVWTNVVRVAGFPPQAMDVIPLNAMNADSTAWLMETYGSSGDYDLIVIVNTPFVGGSNQNNAQLLANGFGKLGIWLGPSDVTIDTDILMLHPSYCDRSSSIWTDSLGVIQHLARPTTDADSSFVGWDDDDVDWRAYAPVENEDGDSLFMATHESSLQSYIKAASHEHITVPVWRTDTAAYPDSVRALFWISEKDNGSKVWIVPYAGHSSTYGYILTILSMYEPSFTPIDMATVIKEFGNNSDSTGCSVNFQHYLNWCDTNDWKVTFCISEERADATEGAWIDGFADRLLATPSRYRLVMDGYQSMRVDTVSTTAIGLANIAAGIDSFAVDGNWSSVDTTTYFPYLGYYGGTLGPASVVNDVLAPRGLTDLFVIGNADQTGWGCSTAYGLHNPDRIYTSDQNIIKMHPLGAQNPAAGDDTLTINTFAYVANMAAKFNTGAAIPVECGGVDIQFDKDGGELTAKLGIYSGCTYHAGTEFIDHADDYTLAWTVAQNLPDYNAIFTLMVAKDYMDFHNHIAARYTQTGIVPFRNVFIRDVHYDRVLDREYPNQHVKEGGYE